ncbi:hypothetical protein [Enterococcus timonensis]|uniref:hypothetical protein n=1 Tax=Enterococcus timonensis TaxID=1852364 RepID=UPI0008D8DD3F|nr:hypothetical protein [Enterococcus timonensis]
MKKFLLFASLLVGFIGFAGIKNVSASEEVISPVVTNNETAQLFDESGNLLDGFIITEESEAYSKPSDLLLRSSVGHMVYKDITVTRSSQVTVVPKTIIYSQLEPGYSTPFYGTLYYQGYTVIPMTSYNLYYIRYSGTVSAYLG